jgi:hypothetical protein
MISLGRANLPLSPGQTQSNPDWISCESVTVRQIQTTQEPPAVWATPPCRVLVVPKLARIFALAFPFPGVIVATCGAYASCSLKLCWWLVGIRLR